jgi:hypothetical protein
MLIDTFSGSLEMGSVQTKRSDVGIDVRAL